MKRELQIFYPSETTRCDSCHIKKSLFLLVIQVIASCYYHFIVGVVPKVII